MTAIPAIVAPHVRDLDDLATTLRQWLLDRAPDARDVTISNLAYPRGAGLSHETILFDAAWQRPGGVERQGLVVRIKPSKHFVYQDDMFVEQYHIMRAMRASGHVRVAAPLWIEEDAGLLGAPFFVMEKVTGRVTVSFPPYSKEGWLVDATPDQRRILWEDAVGQLASIQKVPLSDVPFLVPEGGAEAGFAQEWDRFSRYFDWMAQTRRVPFLEQAFALLERTMPAHRPAGIVWGDARLGNMMVGNDFRVTAVMDWEQPSIGGALHDLGWWLMSDLKQTTARGLKRLDGMGSREETLALWSAVSGIPTTDIEWYEAFAAFKTACIFVRMLDMTLTPRTGEDYGDNMNSRVLADYLGMSAPTSIMP
ncbi:MAG: phosphotransferase family protein [Sphingobium sp.]